MKLEIHLNEVRIFLSNYYQIDIGLEYIGENKIKINYFVPFVLSIKEVKADEVIFNYEINVLANILVKSAHLLLKKKLENIPIEWDSKAREVVVDLKKIKSLNEFIKFLFISELRFVNETILLELNAKQINK